MRSASGIASSTAFSRRARLVVVGDGASPFACPSTASSKGRFVPSGGVFGRSAIRCVPCSRGGGGGEEIGLPFLCGTDGLRVPGVKKLCVLFGFGLGVFADSCSRRCSLQSLSRCSLMRLSLTGLLQTGHSTIARMSGRPTYATRGNATAAIGASSELCPLDDGIPRIYACSWSMQLKMTGRLLDIFITCHAECRDSSLQI
jgi:hypothetical protein